MSTAPHVLVHASWAPVRASAPSTCPRRGSLSFVHTSSVTPEGRALARAGARRFEAGGALRGGAARVDARGCGFGLPRGGLLPGRRALACALGCGRAAGDEAAIAAAPNTDATGLLPAS